MVGGLTTGTTANAAAVLSCFYKLPSQRYYYYAVLFGEATATDLVNAFAVVYGGGGFFASVWGGAICDKLGILWCVRGWWRGCLRVCFVGARRELLRRCET